MPDAGRRLTSLVALNYYNEFDPKAAEWLRQLIWIGAIPDGEVDTRSIEDVTPNDLDGYTQHHFFAGIGGWSLALGLAGWPVTEPVWTGSCPCQPFSAAGKGAGFADERHLWPAFFHLIVQRRPSIIFGEQVAGPDGLTWLDLVQTDLEGEGYATGTADLCAASVGAPHIRQRLYWVADSNGGGRSARSWHDPTSRHGPPAAADSVAVRVADAKRGTAEYRRLDMGGAKSAVEGTEKQREWLRHDAGSSCNISGLADDGSEGRRQVSANLRGGREGSGAQGVDERSVHGGALDVGDADGARSQGWSQRWYGTDQRSAWEASLVDCRDGKQRPVEPGPQSVVNGLPEDMEYMRSVSYVRVEKEIADASISEANTREALLNLWLHLAAETVQRSIGGLYDVREAPILLTILRKLAGEGWKLLDHLPSACWQSPEVGLRALLSPASPFACASSGRKPRQQCPGEFTDALSVVSQAIAHEAEMCVIPAHPLVKHYPGRVGLLRGYGNAIVPQVAVEFIGAYLDANR